MSDSSRQPLTAADLNRNELKQLSELLEKAVLNIPGVQALLFPHQLPRPWEPQRQKVILTSRSTTEYGTDLHADLYLEVSPSQSASVVGNQVLELVNQYLEQALSAEIQPVVNVHILRIANQVHQHKQPSER